MEGVSMTFVPSGNGGGGGGGGGQTSPTESEQRVSPGNRLPSKKGPTSLYGISASTGFLGHAPEDSSASAAAGHFGVRLYLICYALRSSAWTRPKKEEEEEDISERS
ncbi:uncharacterized protein CCOS01_05796 [Colletotrichum costaricense]|uniref:Uncharacterized protein n=1 Tax=Colletotrichum costaricense TaxID=1209916 RepID=A0AAI9Z160_9PEZI|nr:uncharacterized protein CCOS01_05796 [Colletotrichum costaricense]KAK1530693.1 hypothetical protein CCOS01_05796 [Colletotrichum costaricense]